MLRCCAEESGNGMISAPSALLRRRTSRLLSLARACPDGPSSPRLLSPAALLASAYLLLPLPRLPLLPLLPPHPLHPPHTALRGPNDLPRRATVSWACCWKQSERWSTSTMLWPALASSQSNPPPAAAPAPPPPPPPPPTLAASQHSQHALAAPTLLGPVAPQKNNAQPGSTPSGLTGRDPDAVLAISNSVAPADLCCHTQCPTVLKPGVSKYHQPGQQVEPRRVRLPSRLEYWPPLPPLPLSLSSSLLYTKT
ncbi:hypothetical protein BS50DRAFT_223210 [Corynespora cassiicola Philippines]|uniref:Uncharacterized protein n=1 Tax=Corynespora cassiicola Philippines TaxID=1448308 RepID=A0A2T2N2P4_CORCC|nr:hypothetical protein BS50DRAFT_223210 [Corynespora cassiicola Philippines]